MKRALVMILALSGCYAAHEVPLDDNGAECRRWDECPEICHVPRTEEWELYRSLLDCPWDLYADDGHSGS